MVVSGVKWSYSGGKVERSGVKWSGIPEAGKAVTIGMFLGTYNHSIDSKGRLIVPAKFRADLGKDFFITRGLNGCLNVYPMEAWKEVTAQLKTIPMTDVNGRKFMKFLIAGASGGEIDGQGRISLAANQKEYANISKDVAIVGNIDYFEIWDKEKWEEFDNDNVDMVTGDPSIFANLGI